MLSPESYQMLWHMEDGGFHYMVLLGPPSSLLLF